jgi:translation initiation factor 4B
MNRSGGSGYGTSPNEQQQQQQQHRGSYVNRQQRLSENSQKADHSLERDQQQQTAAAAAAHEDTSNTSLNSTDTSLTTTNVPKERPKLNLLPRTKPLEPQVEAAEVKSSIFGGAKPVDTTARERVIEEKILHAAKSNEDAMVVV